MKWSALYLPQRPLDSKDPSRHGFKTKKEATEFILNNMCSGCLRQRKGVLEGNPENEWDSAYPGCYWEWMVIKTKELNKDYAPDELFKAAGWKTIYEKDASKAITNGETVTAPFVKVSSTKCIIGSTRLD